MLVVQIALIFSYVGVDLDDDGDQEVHHDDHDDELVQGPGNPDEADDGAVCKLDSRRIIRAHLRRPGGIVRWVDVANGVAKSFQDDSKDVREISKASL